eukprot:jgi/Hompol1/5544/HPOL_004524-RA
MRKTGIGAGNGKQYTAVNMEQRRMSMPRLNTATTATEAKKMPETEDADHEPWMLGPLKWRFSKKLDTEIYSIKFSPDEDYIAASCGDSHISIFSTKTNSRELELRVEKGLRVPCTSIVYRPDLAAYKNRNILAASYADGFVRHWHYTSGKLLSTISEGDNQINMASYNSDGSVFATVGSDMHVRTYDGPTQAPIFKVYAGRGEVTAGHSNRIFCVKFHPKDKNMLISGGWDNTMQIWDQRVNYAVRSIYGPHICGDSIDFNESGSHLLSGSYVKDDPLQLWSWQSGQLVESVPWSQMNDSDVQMCMLYSAQFSKNLDHPVYSTAISPRDKMIALGGGGKTLIVCDIDESGESR